MPHPDRRAVVLSLASLAACAPQPSDASSEPPVVALLGDSITAGYGLSSEQALPRELERALARSGVAARVIGAGVSGDTTSGGLARVDQVIARKPDVCVVALGANDLLQGRRPSQVRANLDAIVARLQRAEVKVVLAGMLAPAFVDLLEPGYSEAYNGAFSEVARERRVVFHPFLLEGVALNPRLNQPDRIHPNAEGVKIIAARLAPAVTRAIRAARAI